MDTDWRYETIPMSLGGCTKSLFSVFEGLRSQSLEQSKTIPTPTWLLRGCQPTSDKAIDHQVGGLHANRDPPALTCFRERVALEAGLSRGIAFIKISQKVTSGTQPSSPHHRPTLDRPGAPRYPFAS
ncbi:hypothetical protein PGT21_020754 [Puccinia graminis f. sp. tritici]|uniref:Uncharacterized protein n=1 Tax=Puccinia graminis f. sp. tritici TaxID=56615 RepID=A0A5B0LPS2_PUCGR|nr:hypothetical protein PGT21_020754 [Puccinia graminis f. sp. tritici]